MQTIDLDILRLEDGHQILDLGCGRGRHTHAAYFHRRCHSVGLDLGLEDVLTTQQGFLDHPDLEPQTGHARRYDLMVGDALSLPFADNSFDRLICSEVLEHIPDYAGALAEIWRVTKPGGRIGISVPHRWPEQICWMLSRAYYDVPGGHVRIFKRHELRRDIEAMGFTYLTRHLTHGLSGLSGEELCDLYAETTIAVSPSVYEGFGFPAGEALSCGVPLVATDGGSLPEVVGDAGIVVPHSNPPALARAIDDLLRDEEKRDQMAIKARQHILDNFKWERCARDVVQLYRQTIAAHAPNQQHT